jgi:hypothetical protein
MRYPKSGSADGPQILTPGLPLTAFLVDDDAVYYLREDELIRQPKDGTPSTRIASLLGKPGRMVADADAIYVSNSLTCEGGEPCTDDRTLLWRVRKDGSAQEPVVRSGLSSVVDLAVDDEHAFFIRHAVLPDDALERADKQGGVPEPVLLDGATVRLERLAIDGDSLYVSDDRRIVRTRKAGGATRVVVGELAARITGVWIGAEHVFWTNNDDAGHVQLRRARKDGTQGHLVVDGRDAYGLALDQGAAYYVTCEGDTATVWMTAG